MRRQHRSRSSGKPTKPRDEPGASRRPRVDIGIDAVIDMVTTSATAKENLMPSSTAGSAVRSPIWPFQQSYAQSPDHFFARAPLHPVSNPRLIRLNEPLSSGVKA